MLAAIIVRFRWGFSDFKTKLDANALFGTLTHRKNRYDTTEQTQPLATCVMSCQTCTNMSRLVANTSHPVNNHYNSNPDTIWTNLVCSKHEQDIYHKTVQATGWSWNFMLVIFTKICHKNSSLIKLDKNIRTLHEYLSVFYFFTINLHKMVLSKSWLDLPGNADM